MTNQPPDSPRPVGVDEELEESTKPQMDRLGRPDLDESLDADERDELADEARPGQNSDWLPQ